MKIDFRRTSKSLYLSWILLLVFFSVFIIFPLLCVAASINGEHIKAVFTQKIWHKAMLNTLIECVCSSTISVLVGYAFAYAISYKNIPFKRFFSIIPILHLMTPPFVGGLGFILLVGRRGFITHTLLHLDVSLYGFWGLLIAQVLCFFPIAYLICLQTLQSINPHLEQAAKSLGVSSAKIFFTITLPLSVPGILSSLLFIAVNVLSDFGNPLIVGGRFKVLAVEIYTQLTGWLNVGTSAALGIVLVVPSLILFFLQNRFFKHNNLRFATVNGLQRVNNSQQKMSKGAFVFVMLVSLCIISQLMAIIAGSFQKLWGINRTFTLDHMRAVLYYKREIINSVLFAVLAAFLSTIIAMFASFISNRTKMPLLKTLDIFSQLPSAIPGSLFGLSFLIASNKMHLRWSAFLIVMVMTVSYLPFSYKIITSTFSQIKTSLDDSARSLGANQLSSLFTVLMPVAKGGIFSGFVYSFVRGVGTLSAVIFLVSFKTPLTSIKIINLAEQGDWGKAAALSLVLTIITFSLLIAGLFINTFWILKKGRS